MDKTAYEAFTQELIDTLRDRDDVVGLVALGSMAARNYRPDAWSDHDFFVVTRPGGQEPYRAHCDWLPRSEEIAWSFHETEHGVKVIYNNAHLLEFAVFDGDELHLAKVNRYRVLLDKSDVGVRMAAVQASTTTERDGTSDTYHAGQFLTNLLVGIGRYRRGEVLSAHQFVKSNALHHLTALLVRHGTAAQPTLADNLAPTRRFEFIHPVLGPELGALILRPIPEAAQGMLALFVREIDEAETAVPAAVIDIVAAQLNDAEGDRHGP